MAAVKTQSSLSQQAGMQAVDLTKLNLMQLTQFKNGLDTDLQFYQESLQNLKLAQSKYVLETVTIQFLRLSPKSKFQFQVKSPSLKCKL